MGKAVGRRPEGGEEGGRAHRPSAVSPSPPTPPTHPTPPQPPNPPKPPTKQRVALVLCLGQPADIYLIDEPSAYLDSEQRIVSAKVIKRFIMHAKKTAFIVEHDFIMARVRWGWLGGLLFEF